MSPPVETPWPLTSVEAASIVLTPIFRSQVAGGPSPVTGTEVIHRGAGERWAMQVHLNDLYEEEWRALVGCFLGLHGMVGRLLVPVWDYAAPAGSIGGTVTATGTANADQLTLSGGTGTGVRLKRGDMIGIAHRVYMITADWTSGPVQVWPPVRGGFSGAAVALTYLLTVMRFKSDDAVKLAIGGAKVGTLSDFDLIEPLP